MSEIYHFGLSGGKDSTALLGWAIHESGYPKELIRCSFCDTGNEYDEVYEQIKKLNEICLSNGIAPIRTLRNTDSKWTWNSWPLFLALAIWKGRFPSAKARFCTEHLKIIPTQHYIEELQLEGHEIIAHSGVRASESIERSMMSEWDNDQFSCKLRRPLLKWTLAEIWDAHRKWGLPINPLYLSGRKRVGCRLCIMSNKQDVRLTVKFRKWVIDLYRSWEEIVGASRVTRGILCDYSSFFNRNTVPKQHRSRDVITKQGVMKIATIDDVAYWSQTLRGGKQHGFDFMYEEEDFNRDDAAAPCQSGYCE